MNVTYTAADAPAGLVPFLNKVARSPPSRTLLISLPAGTVSRGSGDLSIPSGLSITLQGHGKNGVGNTTLDLQQQNLDLGAMLGDTGRMEFSGMHITNVRPLRAAVRAVCDVAVCAGSFGIPLPRIDGLRSALVQCRFGCCFACCSLGSVALCLFCACPDRTRADARASTRTPIDARGNALGDFPHRLCE